MSAPTPVKVTRVDVFFATVARYRKAVLGFITPGVVALVAAVTENSPGGSHITGPEWVGIGAAMVLTGGLVFQVPNKTLVPDAQINVDQPKR